jgi:putative addiction module component (TIGR02574 family)
MPSVMPKSKIVQELRELNVIERLNIITDMWDEIKESRELELVSDEEKKLLLNRLANYRSNPGSAKDWKDLKQEVYERYDKKS